MRREQISSEVTVLHDATVTELNEIAKECASDYQRRFKAIFGLSVPAEWLTRWWQQTSPPS